MLQVLKRYLWCGVFAFKFMRTFRHLHLFQGDMLFIAFKFVRPMRIQHVIIVKYHAWVHVQLEVCLKIDFWWIPGLRSGTSHTLLLPNSWCQAWPPDSSHKSYNTGFQGPTYGRNYLVGLFYLPQYNLSTLLACLSGTRFATLSYQLCRVATCS